MLYGINMDEQNKGIGYSDSDVAKLAGADSVPNESETQDDMFEDLYVPGSTQEETPATEAPATEGWATGEGTTEGADNASTEETVPEWEPTTEGSEGWITEGVADDDDLPPEVRALLDSIGSADSAQNDAQQNVDEAIGWGNVEEIRKAYEDLKVVTEDKDRQIQQLLKQVASERANSDRLLDENLLQQTNNREMQVMADTIADNPALKDIIVYMRNPDDERSQARLKDAVTRLFEEVTWTSVSDLIENRKRNEKMEMGEWAYDTTGTTPETNNLGGMLEDLS